ncbi:hypothetical protein [Streptomyces durocortorensis]|uniref:Uncharacterized protein n=1 Tax=Streptomyces durocortorensis TaxID=2811104 RepID=A0ABS2HW19_9ACTN|nr:hypothetical protein [Streptomyces durocortorensis]MBM7053703.1 hypothetical protein [Streptomyces durocortorensis]
MVAVSAISTTSEIIASGSAPGRTWAITCSGVAYEKIGLLDEDRQRAGRRGVAGWVGPRLQRETGGLVAVLFLRLHLLPAIPLGG